MADQDQIIHDLEQRHISLRREYDLVLADRDSLKEKYAASKQESEKLRDEKDVCDRKVTELTAETHQKQTVLEQVAATNEDLRDRSLRRAEECDRLKEELKIQANELINLQNRLKDALTQISEADSQHLPNKFALVRCEQEKNHFEQQVKVLEEELQRKNIAERAYRSATNDKIFQLESRLSDVQNENEEKGKQLALLKEQLTIQEERADNFLQKSTTLELTLSSSQSSFNQEMDNIKRLSDLYKRNFEEATAKIEELEVTLTQVRESYQSRFTSVNEQIKSRLEEYEKSFEQEKSLLESRVLELETELTQTQQNNASSSSVHIVDESQLQTQQNAQQNSLSNTLRTQLLAQDGDINFTEILDKFFTLERDLLSEQHKRREAEIYLNQVLIDVEQKAPIIAKQKREYQRILQSHTSITQKCDFLVEENSILKSTLSQVESRVLRSEKENENYRLQNQDLSRQLQHLLKATLEGNFGTYMGDNSGESNAMIVEGESSQAQNVISESLVLFSSVSDLQQRNTELLSFVRVLTQEKEESENRFIAEKEALLASLPSSQALQEVVNEVQVLRQDRERQEEMVAVLLQQRDMYKSMLDSTSTSTTAQNMTFSSTELTPKTRFFEPLENSTKSSQQIHELQVHISTLIAEKTRVSERLARFEESEKLLHENLEKLRREASQSRLESTQSMSELKYSKEQNERLKSTLLLKESEISSLLNKRNETDKLILELSKELRTRDTSSQQQTEEIRLLTEKLTRTNIDLEVTKSSETRLFEQLAEAREEMKRQVTLTDYLHRIESNLHTRSETEKARLESENENLQHQVVTLKKQVEDRVLLEEQKTRVFEDEIRLLRTKYEGKMNEFAQMSENLIREVTLSKAAQERSALLESQLFSLQQKVDFSSGDRLTTSLFEADLQSKTLLLTQAENEILSLKSQLSAVESHADNYRKISTQNESILRDVRVKHQEALTFLQSENNVLVLENNKIKEEMNEMRNNSTGFLLEIDRIKHDSQLAITAQNETVRTLQDQLRLLTSTNDSLTSNEDSLKAEIERLQRQAQQAHENYERELQLHATAERAVREERTLHTQTKDNLRKMTDQLASVKGDLLRAERTLQEEQHRVQSDIATLQAQSASLQQTNDLLHSQVQSYGVQIEKLQEKQESSLLAAAGSSSIATANEASSSTEAFDETEELRKSSREMREVLRFMKKEKEMLQARFTIAETENSRYISQIQSLSKALDEVRIELKHETEKHVSVHNEEEFARLMQEVNQLNIIRESNNHLRHENDDLHTRVTTLTTQVQAQQASTAPLQDNLRKLQAEKEALELVNDQLTNDVGFWRDRLHGLIARFNDIDPEDYRQIKQALETANTKLSTLEATIAEQEERYTHDMEVKEKELSSARALAEGSDRNATLLRDRLRQFKERYTGLSTANTATQAALEQQVSELQAQVTAMQGQVEELQEQNAALLIADGAKNQQIAQLKAVAAAAPAAAFQPSDTSAAPAAAPPTQRGKKQAPPPAAAVVSAAIGEGAATAPAVAAPPSAGKKQPAKGKAAAAAAASTSAAKPPPPAAPFPAAAGEENASVPPATSQAQPVEQPVAAVPAPPAATVSETSKAQSLKDRLAKRKNRTDEPAAVATGAPVTEEASAVQAQPAPSQTAAVEEEPAAKRVRFGTPDTVEFVESQQSAISAPSVEAEAETSSQQHVNAMEVDQPPSHAADAQAQAAVEETGVTAPLSSDAMDTTPAAEAEVEVNAPQAEPEVEAEVEAPAVSAPAVVPTAVPQPQQIAKPLFASSISTSSNPFAVASQANEGAAPFTSSGFGAFGRPFGGGISASVSSGSNTAGAPTSFMGFAAGGSPSAFGKQAAPTTGGSIFGISSAISGAPVAPLFGTSTSFGGTSVTKPFGSITTAMPTTGQEGGEEEGEEQEGEEMMGEFEGDGEGQLEDFHEERMMQNADESHQMHEEEQVDAPPVPQQAPMSFVRPPIAPGLPAAVNPPSRNLFAQAALQSSGAPAASGFGSISGFGGGFGAPTKSLFGAAGASPSPQPGAVAATGFGFFGAGQAAAAPAPGLPVIRTASTAADSLDDKKRNRALRFSSEGGSVGGQPAQSSPLNAQAPPATAPVAAQGEGIAPPLAVPVANGPGGRKRSTANRGGRGGQGGDVQGGTSVAGDAPTGGEGSA